MDHVDDIHAQLDSLKEDMARLRSDLGGILSSIMDATRTEAGEARERLEAHARQQMNNLAGAWAGARDQGREMAGRVCEHIEEHPMASILGALGAGFLVGFMAGRK